MSARAPVSVVVITRDEERNVARCLASVAWADERVVVDNGSRDATVEVARREGAVVRSEPWRGFVETRNRALAHARHDWVLCLDADEWLSEEAAAEVRAVLVRPTFAAYRVPRRTALCGAFVDHAWSGDRPIRLFRRSVGRFAGGRVHESVALDDGARCGRLREPILHLSYRTIHDYVDRMNRYTDLAAAGGAATAARPSLARATLGAAAALARTWVVRRGFLDGRRGWIVAVGAAMYVFLREAKRWETWRDTSAELARLAGATPEDPDPDAPPRARGDQSG